MAGYATLLKFRSAEEQANRLGMRFAHSRYGDRAGTFGELIALFPLDERLPVYSRDAELYAGSLEDVIHFMRGIEWARAYDEMLSVSNDKRRVKGEEKEVARQAMRKLKEDQKKMWEILNKNEHPQVEDV